MTNQQTLWLHARPAMLAACLALAAGTMTRADDVPLVAGEWRVTFDGGTVHVYAIDRHGRMEGTLDGVKVTGQAVRQNDQFTNLTFRGNDHLARLWLNSGKDLTVSFFDRKADFPAQNATRTGSGVRQKDTPAFWEPEPNPRINNLAGQWTVVYYSPTGSDPREVAFRGMVRIYTFDASGNVRGREGNQSLTGRVRYDDRRAMLLTLNERPDEIERITPRVDGRVDFEHWRPRSKFPASLRTEVGVGTPVTGKSAPGVEKLDVLMLDCLRQIDCSGATLAIARGNHVYYARGYGWSDYERNVPIAPDTPMCTASCGKPLTAAMIRQCLKERNLPLNFTVLPFFRVKPVGEVVDKRVWDITVENLIDHRAGWQGKPVEQAWQAYNGHTFPVAPEDVLPYIAVQRLSFAPGAKEEYDNFGYGVLGRMVPVLSGQDWYDYLRYHLLRPYGVQELKGVRHGDRRNGEPPPLWNGLIMEDMPVNRGGVSMPAFCTFMSHFWIDGKPRDDSHPTWIHTGSWDNATTQMTWRPDGINVAWSFNGRAAGADPGKALWDDAINELVDHDHIPRR